MSNDIIPANPFTKMFEGHNIRILIENDAPFFHLGDVLKALESKSRVANIKKTLDSDGVLTKNTIDSMRRPQESSFINEPALLELLGTLRVPKTKEFRRWIFREVIPTVMATGEYSVEGTKKVTPLIKHEEGTQEIEMFGALAKVFREEFGEDPLGRVDEASGRRMKFYKYDAHRGVFERALRNIVSRALPVEA